MISELTASHSNTSYGSLLIDPAIFLIKGRPAGVRSTSFQNGIVG